MRGASANCVGCGRVGCTGLRSEATRLPPIGNLRRRWPISAPPFPMMAVAERWLQHRSDSKLLALARGFLSVGVTWRFACRQTRIVRFTLAQDPTPSPHHRGSPGHKSGCIAARKGSTDLRHPVRAALQLQEPLGQCIVPVKGVAGTANPAGGRFASGTSR